MPLKIKPDPDTGIWQITGTVAGQRIRKSASTTDRRRAEAVRLRIETELENRFIYGPRAVASFAEAVNGYLDAGGDGRYLLPLLERFKKTRLADLGQNDINQAAKALYPDAAPSTLNRCAYTPFIAVMNYAAEQDLCAWRKWRRPKGHDKKTRFRWLWPQEVEAVIAAAPPHGRIIMELLIATGLRESEAVGLEWADLSPDQREAWIWQTKSDEPRRVEIGERAHAAIKRTLHRDGPILLDGGGAPFVLSPNGGGALKTSLKIWAMDAGVAPFGAHVLRHTYATWFYAQTRDLIALKALGGWKSKSYERYAHLAPHGLADTLARHGWRFDLRNKNWQEIGKQHTAEIINLRNSNT